MIATLRLINSTTKSVTSLSNECCSAYRWPLADQAMGCCDFYLPQANSHIECWQLHEEAASISQKLLRIDHYKKQQLAFLELKSEDLNRLDNVLPKLLLKHGITVY